MKTVLHVEHSSLYCADVIIVETVDESSVINAHGMYCLYRTWAMIVQFEFAMLAFFIRFVYFNFMVEYIDV